MRIDLKSILMAAVVATAFTACTEEEGQAPGNDSTPNVTFYQYEASGDYNPDNDLYFRFAANSATKDVYYLVEKQSDKEARNLSDDAYADYVVANGTKAEASAIGGSQDVIVTDLHGMYSIAVVATNGSLKKIVTSTFAGLDYKPLGTGNYYSDFFEEEWPVEVEYSEIGNRYRIVDNWYEGYGLVWTVDGSTASCIPTRTETGYVHSTYGMVYALDQGSSYDESTKTFTFNFRWQVILNGGWAAFGNYPDILTLP